MLYFIATTEKNKGLVRLFRDNVRVEDGGLYLSSISFSLLFSFPFIFILGARVRVWHDFLSHISHSHTIIQFTYHNGR